MKRSKMPMVVIDDNDADDMMDMDYQISRNRHYIDPKTNPPKLSEQESLGTGLTHKNRMRHY